MHVFVSMPLVFICYNFFFFFYLRFTHPIIVSGQGTLHSMSFNLFFLIYIFSLKDNKEKKKRKEKQ